MTAHRHPELSRIKCRVHTSPHGYAYVRPLELRVALGAARISVKRFNDAFGMQTCPEEGYYASDVDVVLRRMRTGEKEHPLVWD